MQEALEIIKKYTNDETARNSFSLIADFLTETKENSNLDSATLTKLARKFTKERSMPCPSMPSTITDDIIALILERFYNETNVEEALKHHKQAMSAENIIGKLLERYIASVAEPAGWAWCSGSIVKSTDFIKRSKRGWIQVQIKNRDNSENSSSASVRQDTEIKKWFRTFSRTGKTNWENFPDKDLKEALTESNFRTYVIQYLQAIKG